MNIFETYRNHVLAAVEAVAPGYKTEAVTLEPPRDASHGDLSTNAAMVLAGQGESQAARDGGKKLQNSCVAWKVLQKWMWRDRASSTSR